MKRKVLWDFLYNDLQIILNIIISSQGGDVQALADDGASILFEAAGGGNPDCIALLLEYGGSGNVPNKAGLLPIHKAAYEGHYL